MAPNQVAGEVLSFFTRNNLWSPIGVRLSPMLIEVGCLRLRFKIKKRTLRTKTVATLLFLRFKGMMVPSRGLAALLTFCTCVGLASVALVLTITFPDVGNNWFWITVLSPLA